MSTRLTREARWRRVGFFVGVVGLAVIVTAAAFFGRSPAPAWASGVAAVAAGDIHTCALTAAGGVKCWGSNGYGQLGDGTTTDRTTQVDVVGLASGVAAVTAGGRHTCALTMAGGVKCWGRNGDGQLGDGTTMDRTSPVDVSGLTSGVASLAVGEEHTCALTTAGGVKCWGRNSEGQLGDGQGCGTPCTAPVHVSGLGSGVAGVAGGQFHTCALTTAGGVKCWGWNFSGQLGDGTTTQRTMPVGVTGLGSGVANVSGGDLHTCALITAGGLKCWGRNGEGQLGDGQGCGFQCAAPVDVVALGSGAAAVDAGGRHTCALTTAGGVKCWGVNGGGQLGDGTTTQRTIPVDVSGLAAGVAAVAAGAIHTCALTTAGGVKCWGANYAGQLGDGTSTGPQSCVFVACSTTPVDVAGLGPKPTPTATATSTPTPTATPPRPLGGVAAYPDLSSGQNNALVVGVIAALAISAIALGGATWYTRRRRFE